MERQMKKQKDKLEVAHKRQIESQRVKIGVLKPKKNHTLFEVDLSDYSIKKAVFDKPPVLSWADAKSGNYSKKLEITKRPNCLYIPALNEKNVVKILERDYGILVKN